MSFFIVVIDASAGGQEAICKLIASLPQRLNAAIFVVIHISRYGIENFPANRLQKCTMLHCRSAVDAGALEPGNIYIAPAHGAFGDPVAPSIDAVQVCRSILPRTGNWHRAYRSAR